MHPGEEDDRAHQGDGVDFEGTGNVSISGVDTEIVSEIQFGINFKGNGSCELQEVTVRSPKAAVRVEANGNSSAGNIIVKSGTYETTGKSEDKHWPLDAPSELVGMRISTTGKVIIGVSGGEVGRDAPCIIGASYALYAPHEETSNWEFYDGIFKGKLEAISVEPTKVEPGYEVKYSTEKIAGEVYQTAFLDRILAYGEGTFITKWKIPGTDDGYTVTLPVPANANNNYTVCWGDGYIETYTNQDFPTHTYTNALDQTFTMGIGGTVWYYGYYQEEKPTANNAYAKYYPLTDRLVEIVDWGSIHARRYGFSHCGQLQGNIPIPYGSTGSGVTGKTSFESIESMENLFYQCTQLGGEIPANFTEAAINMVSARNVFGNAQKIKGTIPGDLFANKTKITNFAEAFQGCQNLTGIIPATLFSSATNGQNFTKTFYGCTQLIGGEIDINTDTVTNMNQMFANCSSLENLVLDGDFKKLDGQNMFQGDGKLTAVILLYVPSSKDAIGGIDATISQLTSQGKLYVANEGVEEWYETVWSTVAKEKIQSIIEPLPPNPTTVKIEDPYTDPGYTVAGYNTTTEVEKYTRYGFSVQVIGNPVNTSTIGTKEVRYELHKS